MGRKSSKVERSEKGAEEKLKKKKVHVWPTGEDLSKNKKGWEEIAVKGNTFGICLTGRKTEV